MTKYEHTQIIKYRLHRNAVPISIIILSKSMNANHNFGFIGNIYGGSSNLSFSSLTCDALSLRKYDNELFFGN